MGLFPLTISQLGKLKECKLLMCILRKKKRIMCVCQRLRMQASVCPSVWLCASIMLAQNVNRTLWQHVWLLFFFDLGKSPLSLFLIICSITRGQRALLARGLWRNVTPRAVIGVPEIKSNNKASVSASLLTTDHGHCTGRSVETLV